MSNFITFEKVFFEKNSKSHYDEWHLFVLEEFSNLLSLSSNLLRALEHVGLKIFISKHRYQNERQKIVICWRVIPLNFNLE